MSDESLSNFPKPRVSRDTVSSLISVLINIGVNTEDQVFTDLESLADILTLEEMKRLSNILQSDPEMMIEAVLQSSELRYALMEKLRIYASVVKDFNLD